MASLIEDEGESGAPKGTILELFSPNMWQLCHRLSFPPTEPVEYSGAPGHMMFGYLCLQFCYKVFHQRRRGESLARDTMGPRWFRPCQKSRHFSD